MKSPEPNITDKTNTEKYWEYYEYYLGEKDSEERRQGQGENYWSGAKSLESYNGELVRDTMHGVGTYNWKYYGPEGTFFTYEGNCYDNRKHGYGLLSYPDGRVFEGLFYNDLRWGPGVETTHTNLKQDVGLWYKNKLIRLAWRPSGPSVVPDFQSITNVRLDINQFRKILRQKTITIGEVNSAIELLKQKGCDPKVATEKWEKLYPKHCNDLSSQLCHVDFFDKSYYNNCISFLQEYSEQDSIHQPDSSEQEVGDEEPHDSSEVEKEKDKDLIYAWNNNEILVHMMKFSYQQEYQRRFTGLNLTNLLSGPRTSFKQSGKYENNCRNLLMACYLGRVEDVTRLLLDNDVHPDISDVQGNSAIMYAACGDQASIIHFLVESGGNIDGVNDSCCTPLGIALTRYVCIEKDVHASKILEAVLPTPTNGPVPLEENISEWKINRDVSEPKRETPSKVTPSNTRKTKTASSQNPSDSNNSKKENVEEDVKEATVNTDDENTENIINSEFSVKANELYSDSHNAKPVEYLFQVYDFATDADIVEEEIKKLSDKSQMKKAASKLTQETTKLSKDQLYQESVEKSGSIDSDGKIKREMLQVIQSTISQLLADGADPKLVKFPQPALFIAVVSGITELIQQFVDFGADVNEHYPHIFNYTPLDIALSQKFTADSVEVIRVLLENGADASHRLDPTVQDYSSSSDGTNNNDIIGPTLLHPIILRKLDSDNEEEKRQDVINLLLQYKCDPLAQYKGISAIELCLTRSKELLNTLIQHPSTNLNGIINSSNQSVLVKMFTPTYFKSLGSERLQMLTNLLLHGADPLRQCQNEDETYQNLFVFAKKTLETLKSSKSSTGVTPIASKMRIDIKKPKMEDKKMKGKQEQTRQSTKTSDDVTDYREALDLVTSCARILHIRWLQAKLFKVLTEVVHAYKHRMWNMIIKEHKQKVGLNTWVTVQRGLEVWDVLSKAKPRIYHDKTVLKYTLYIIHFYEIAQTLHKLRAPFMTASEKAEVESYVNALIRENKQQSTSSSSNLKSSYLMPELASKKDTKFNVCFECALPLNESKIVCKKCKLVFFCSKDCIIANCGKVNTHPCSMFLKAIYGLIDKASPDETAGADSTTSPKMNDLNLTSSAQIAGKNK